MVAWRAKGLFWFRDGREVCKKNRARRPRSRGGSGERGGCPDRTDEAGDAAARCAGAGPRGSDAAGRGGVGARSSRVDLLGAGGGGEADNGGRVRGAPAGP